MPNRIIKESIRTSKRVNALTDFQFRLWVHLITYVDDYGRGSADPEILKGFVFPRRKQVTESDIRKTLAELADNGRVNLYEVDGESYFYFPNWGKHQRIQTKRSKYPEPSKNGESRKPTVNHGEPPLESNPIQSELESESESESKECACAQYHFSPELQLAIDSWTTYKKEMRKPYKPQGMKAFLKKVNGAAEKHGEQAVIRAIEESMSNGWQGVVWEKLDKPQGEKKPWEKTPRALDYPQRKYSEADLSHIGIKFTDGGE